MRVFLVALVAIIGMCGVVQAYTNHYYLNGRAESVSEDSLRISGKTFSFAPTFKVVVQVMKNGAIFEERARLRDIREGESITVCIDSTKVTEVIIERWKQ